MFMFRLIRFFVVIKEVYTPPAKEKQQNAVIIIDTRY